MASRLITAHDIRDTVTEEFLRSPKARTVAQIAEDLFVSEGVIRRVLDANHGLIPGLAQERVGTIGRATAWAFAPTRNYLAELLLAAVHSK